MSKFPFIALMAAGLITPAVADEPALQRILDETSLHGGWDPATAKRMRADEALFFAQLTGRPGVDPSGAWRRTEISAGVFGLHEAPERLAGRGVYVIGTLPGDGLLVQAPHRFKDLHTGAIVAGMIAESPPSAAAFNSVPRRYEKGNEMVSADMAHREASTMIAFTRALLRANPFGRVVQLHGYASEKRRSAAGSSADLIVSNGTRHSSPYAQAVVACLTRALPDRKTLLYPRDVSELGGTTNTVGAGVRALIGLDHFLHIEANLPTRIALKEDRRLRKGLMTCLRQVP